MYEWLQPLIGAAVPVFGALGATTRQQGRARRQLKHDAELIALLPENSAARKAWLEHVNWEIAQLKTLETTGSRDKGSAAIALFFAIGLGVGSVFLLVAGQWWLIAAGAAGALLTLMCMASAVDLFALRDRSAEKGKSKLA